MSKIKTKLNKANQSQSLRTTVPAGIRAHFGLKEGDFLKWDLDKIDGKWVVIIIPSKDE